MKRDRSDVQQQATRVGDEKRQGGGGTQGAQNGAVNYEPGVFAHLVMSMMHAQWTGPGSQALERASWMWPLHEGQRSCRDMDGEHVRWQASSARRRGLELNISVFSVFSVSIPGRMLRGMY